MIWACAERSVFAFNRKNQKAARFNDAMALTNHFCRIGIDVKEIAGEDGAVKLAILEGECTIGKQRKDGRFVENASHAFDVGGRRFNGSPVTVILAEFKGDKRVAKPSAQSRFHLCRLM